jgi:hypothetical protein
MDDGMAYLVEHKFPAGYGGASGVDWYLSWWSFSTKEEAEDYARVQAARYVEFKVWRVRFGSVAELAD